MAFFCYNRPGFLLLPEMPFATTGVFSTTKVFLEASGVFATTLCFCFVFAGTILKNFYHRLLILLEPAFFALVSAVKAGGVLVRRRR